MLTGFYIELSGLMSSDRLCSAICQTQRQKHPAMANECDSQAAPNGHHRRREIAFIHMNRCFPPPRYIYIYIVFCFLRSLPSYWQLPKPLAVALASDFAKQQLPNHFASRTELELVATGFVSSAPSSECATVIVAFFW